MKMMLKFVIRISSAFLGIAICYIIHRMYHNYQAHQFFKRKAPHLFVREIPSILAGNADAIFDPRCWKDNYEHHMKYGKTVCFYYGDLPVVSTLDLDFIKKFAIDDANDHINRPPPKIAVDEFEYDCIMFAEGAQWHKIRRAIGPAFSLHKIKSPNVEREINEVVQELVESLEWRLDRTENVNDEQFIILDAEELAHRYSLALVFKCLYKQSDVIDFKADVDPIQHFIEKGYESFGLAAYFMKINLMFPILRPLIRYLAIKFSRLAPVRIRILGYIKQQMNLYSEAKRQIIEAKKRDVDNETSLDEFSVNDGSIFRKNMIDYVIEKYSEGSLTEREYIHSTFFLFFAADKTSADSISKLIYCLAAYPEVQKKARKSISEEGIESKYLLWTLNEALRLYPPSLTGCSRVVTKDMQSKDGIIPAGSYVLTPTYAINRLKEYWGEDADEFKPERWENSKNFHPIQFLTFGAGKRSCPGKEFAMHELKVLSYNLITKFEFELTDRKLQIDEFMSPLFVFNHAEYPTWIMISRFKAAQGSQ